MGDDGDVAQIHKRLKKKSTAGYNPRHVRSGI
jgi:hypothetical protein